MRIENIGRARKFVQGLGREPERSHPHTECRTETSQTVGECLVFNRRCVNQFSALRPDRHGKGLVKILAVGLQRRLNPKSCRVQTKWRDSHALLERQHGLVERHFLVGRTSSFPIDQNQLGILP